MFNFVKFYIDEIDVWSPGRDIELCSLHFLNLVPTRYEVVAAS